MNSENNSSTPQSWINRMSSKGLQIIFSISRNGMSILRLLSYLLWQVLCSLIRRGSNFIASFSGAAVRTTKLVVGKVIAHVRGWFDRSEVKPKDWMDFILVMLVPMLLAIFWGSSLKWLGGIDIESARWALSTQSQATAAILALLIAGMIFRWHWVSEEETRFRNTVHEHISALSISDTDVAKSARHALDSAYSEYYSIVCENKKKQQSKTDLISLGRLWVIKEISVNYASSTFPPRLLKRSQIKPLSECGEQASEYAVKMWEHYFLRPSEFFLEMSETLTRVCSTTTHDIDPKSQASEPAVAKTLGDKYGELENRRKKIFEEPVAQRLHPSGLMMTPPGS